MRVFTVTVMVAGLGALLGAPVAGAAGGLLSDATAPLAGGSQTTDTSPSGGLVPVVQTVTGVVEPVTGAVAPVVQTAADTTAPVTSATAPAVGAVASTAAPVVKAVVDAAQPVAPVTTAVAPVVQDVTRTVAPVTKPVTDALSPVTAPVTRAIEPVLKAAAPVVEAAQPVVRAVQPVVDTAAPGTVGPKTGTPKAAQTKTPPMPKTGAIAVSMAPSPSSAEIRQGRPATVRASEPPVTSAPGVADVKRPTQWLGGHPPFLATPRPGSLATPQLFPGSPLDLPRPAAAPDTGVRDAGAAVTPRPRLPLPLLPDVPWGSLSAVAGGSGGPSATLFAALAAAILLVLPRLGRRLSPALAPRPRPGFRPLLERPG